MEDASHVEVLKEREYFTVEFKFEGRDRWQRSRRRHDNFQHATRSASVQMNQEDLIDYRVIKVEKKETLVHP